MRDSRGRFIAAETALDRFLSKCRFDPCTGCVLWEAGQTKGHGHNVPYGSFWFEGRRWFAHRWAARYLLGQDISRPHWQVDHECRNTLCVRHLKMVPATVNRELQWIRTQKGCPDYEYQPSEALSGEIPFYDPPDWWPIIQSDDCPF